MKSQTAFIVFSVILLVAVLYFIIYLSANKKTTVAVNTTPVATQVPGIRRESIVYEPFPQEYLNSFPNPELIRVR